MSWDICVRDSIRVALTIIAFLRHAHRRIWYSRRVSRRESPNRRESFAKSLAKARPSGVYISVRCTTDQSRLVPINRSGDRGVRNRGGTIIIPRRSIWCNYDSQSSDHCRLFRNKSSGILIIINQADLKWALCTRNDGTPLSNRN